ncbi:p-hydroxyphenylacetate 3-hydroxylase, reductase component [Zhongshania aliphaticivorans]|uniref:p-hydroxyphenylacetate 3-hydroxylase, reductase component n=1 Tax=Zhongshania aliphaticivorans TaxID=1470434 RepID=A0A5S9Q1A6_9GAMM|nr:flavin reductase family protein [Zhongshania aliphaticivorans]CAA0111251.1 p-hydroxyphenylacetate 3-hydroxylase, reductase component [Zhongshania aliphaticivorans]CAA0118531.1 p-hydroxyphenylacetate 3-hydroxylase, reductase component [Zhongshania aliphaticivorans]
MAFDKRELRNTLGLFATGVTIMTTVSKAGEVAAMTVNSFTSLSLSPPLVIWSVDLGSSLFDEFNVAEGFAVNILAEYQQEISDLFARSENDQKDMLASFEISELGNPILRGSRAVIECEIKDRITQGDHQIIIGSVMGFSGDASKQPLVFSCGRYYELGAQLG